MQKNKQCSDKTSHPSSFMVGHSYIYDHMCTCWEAAAPSGTEYRICCCPGEWKVACWDRTDGALEIVESLVTIWRS